MSASNIEWTDATWNPTVGCTKDSPGCKHCYAETMHARLTAMGQSKYAKPFTVVRPYPANLDVPLRARKPRRYFVNSMSDLFHEDVPDEYIAAVFGVMAACPQHTFQVLTKRAERMAEWFERVGRAGVGAHRYCGDAAEARGVPVYVKGKDGRSPWNDSNCRWPLSNVWIGVSIEDRKRTDRMEHLVRAPAVVRFLSIEPLLEDLGDLGLMGIVPKDLGVGYKPYYDLIDWVIVGGESGHRARPCDLAWVRSIVKQCRDVDVPVFVKQLGGAASDATNGIAGAALKVPDEAMGLVSLRLRNKKGSDMAEWPVDLRVREFPKEMT